MNKPPINIMIKKEIGHNLYRSWNHFLLFNKLLIRHIWKSLVKTDKHSVNSLGSKLIRFFFNQTIRTQRFSLDEYEHNWTTFNFKKNLEVSDLVYEKNGKPVEQNISSMDFRKLTIISELFNIIDEYNFSSVLEIGSGIGINLIFLGSRYPDKHFYGIEPTESGFRKSLDFISDIPKELEQYGITQKELNNITIIRGSLLDTDFISNLNLEVDLAFTNGVLEQLNNYLKKAFENMFSLPCDYFLIREEWLEANADISQYRKLVAFDYFRVSWKYLNEFPVDIIEYKIPVIQPQWLKYASVLCKKTF